MNERDTKPTKNMKTTFAFIAAVNYDSLGMFNKIATKRIPIRKERKAGVAVVIAENGKSTVRMAARTKADLASARKAAAWLRGVKSTPAVVEATVAVKPTKFTYTFVTKTLRSAVGSKRMKMCKVTSNKGMKKYFTTKKAATAWVKSNG